MHAATKPATLGLLCVVLGAAIALGDIRASTKLALVAVLQFATNPVGSHMVGRAAWTRRTSEEADAAGPPTSDAAGPPTSDAAGPPT